MTNVDWTAAPSSIVAVAGETLTMTLSLLDADGVVIDSSPYTVSSDVFDVTLSAGVVTISLTAAASAAFGASKRPFSVWLTPVSGTDPKICVARGSLTLVAA